jgi:acetyl esterase
MGAGSLLDPEVREWLALNPTPDVDYGDVAAVRDLTSRYMAEHGGPGPRWSRDDVSLTRHQIAGVDVLVWRPLGVSGAPPVVLAFHGGAFIVGSPLGVERIAAPLAGDHGIVTVGIGYRLAPEHRAPAALLDGIAVLEQLDELEGVDTGRVAVHGSSAGAALAVGVAAYARDRGVTIALQSLSCPALDPGSTTSMDPGHSMHGYSPTLTRQSVVAMWKHYLGVHSDDIPAAGDFAGTGHVIPSHIMSLGGLAPAHFTIAEFDVLRDEAMAYASRLEDAGVEVDVDLVQGAVHGFDGLLPDSAIARGAIRRQVDALSAALHLRA